MAVKKKSLCEHQHETFRCVECTPKNFCFDESHGCLKPRRKDNCRLCNKNLMCKHERNKYKCPICHKEKQLLLTAAAAIDEMKVVDVPTVAAADQMEIVTEMKVVDVPTTATGEINKTEMKVVDVPPAADQMEIVTEVTTAATTTTAEMKVVDVPTAVTGEVNKAEKLKEVLYAYYYEKMATVEKDEMMMGIRFDLISYRRSSRVGIIFDVDLTDVVNKNPLPEAVFCFSIKTENLLLPNGELHQEHLEHLDKVLFNSLMGPVHKLFGKVLRKFTMFENPATDFNGDNPAHLIAKEHMYEYMQDPDYWKGISVGERAKRLAEIEREKEMRRVERSQRINVNFRAIFGTDEPRTPSPIFRWEDQEEEEVVESKSKRAKTDDDDDDDGFEILPKRNQFGVYIHDPSPMLRKPNCDDFETLNELIMPLRKFVESEYRTKISLIDQIESGFSMHFGYEPLSANADCVFIIEIIRNAFDIKGFLKKYPNYRQSIVLIKVNMLEYTNEYGFSISRCVDKNECRVTDAVEFYKRFDAGVKTMIRILKKKKDLKEKNLHEIKLFF